MKNKLLILALAVLMTLGWSSQGLSLSEPTHQWLNQYVAQTTINGFSLNDYLLNNLGFQKGVEEIISGFDAKGVTQSQAVFWWLSYGGEEEDRPGSRIDYVLGRPTRSVNHYHNPLRTWSDAGLNDTIRFMGKDWSSTGQSQVLWAQNPNQDPGGHWSWYDARRYYYIALTGRGFDGTMVAPTFNDRNRFLADTFRAVGQLMHLVQDASVPAHVRNSIHIRFNYEDWLEKIRNGTTDEKALFRQFIANPISFDPSILNLVVLDPSIWRLLPEGITTPIPIANIIDTDKYGVSNPDITASNAIGMSEYTNANFFSERTIFSSAFPYPARTSAENTPYLMMDPRGSGTGVTRNYYRKIRDGETGYRLATVGFLKDYIIKYFPTGASLNERPALDGGVYSDYASLLLPRAVGYSAGLLQYFFRGKLQVTAVPIFLQGNLSYMKLKIKNMTLGEAMGKGNFVLTYRYTPSGGSADGSQDIFGQAKGLDGSALVSSVPLGEGDTMEVDFLIDPALPKKDYESIKFTLAFQGSLGNEGGIAVIGKSFAPGDVVFDEEWDKYQDEQQTLPGSYPWGHTDINLDNFNPPNNGVSTNQVENGYLIKDNVRLQGYSSGRFNESVVCDICGGGQFANISPIRITPNTYLMYKIDEMSITPTADPARPQYLLLSFTDGLALEISSQGEQMEYWNDVTAYYTFSLGGIIVANIYDLFKGAEITIPEPFDLRMIAFKQLLYPLQAPSTGEHHQRMKVDFIRIVEGKEQ